MAKKIYGVDPSKKVTPSMVREAIVLCFEQAHKEILNIMEIHNEWESEEERKKFREMEISSIIKDAFRDAGVNFQNPTKEGLVKVLDNLAVFASNFRKPEIIKRHYREVKKLIDKIK